MKTTEIIAMTKKIGKDYWDKVVKEKPKPIKVVFSLKKENGGIYERKRNYG